MSFRQKILFSQFLLLLVLITVLLPLLGGITNLVLREIYKNRVKDLVQTLQKTASEEEMLQMIETDPDFRLQRGALLKDDGSLLKMLPETTEPIDITKHEIAQAVEHGSGYAQRESPTYKKEFFYIAVAFKAHEQRYILYVNFPSYKIEHMKKAFDMTTMIVCICLLVVNAILIMIVVHRVMRPAQQIIDAIRPYREGKEEYLPRIYLSEKAEADEFTKLAATINSLTDQIRKQIDFLTRQREETEEILESIGEGIIAANPSAKIIFANTAACRMLGVMREQILGRTLDSMDEESHDLLKKSHELIVHSLQTAEPAGYLWTLKNKGLSYLNLISTPFAHKDGSLLVIQDKTSDYRILELGKDFIANASHELKTPITIIRGFAETLQDLPELSYEMMMQITEKIVKTCVRLDKLVKSLLTLTDLESLPDKNFTEVDLVGIAERCIKDLLQIHPDTKITFRSELQNAYFSGDATLFELAVMNILENAVKYSRGPAQIDVSIERTERELLLKIKDRGIGISEEDLTQIFERFYTVEKARSRKTGGAGLGLSIVRTIAEKHKGKVLVASELGKGSIFTIILPAVEG